MQITSPSFSRGLADKVSIFRHMDRSAMYSSAACLKLPLTEPILSSFQLLCSGPTTESKNKKKRSISYCFIEHVM